MADRGDRKYSYSDSKASNSSSDDPPNSRLFIICSKQLTEDDFREAFEKFGEIEEIWVVKDRQTGERKGVTYIKYSKTSEAAKAMEAMNGKIIGNTNRQIKVMIAASREQGSRRDSNEEEKIQRLFVIVPKTMTDVELHDVFKQYGDIDYVTIIRDKETRESKGFAYIKYYKFSHAAIAYEQCDRKYKAVFAEPRRPHIRNEPQDKSFTNTYDSFNKTSNNAYAPSPPADLPNEGYTRLHIITSPMINQDQLWKLFDIVPGLDYCQLKLEGRPRPVRGVGTAVYSNAQWATYACHKFHGFEYPPGQRLIVKPDPDSRLYQNPTSSIRNKPDLMQIAETIAQASSLIQAAGLSQDNISKLGLFTPKSNDTALCNVPLPAPKPLVSIDEETAARCFIVCTPQPPPPHVLRDVFCRFGSLIDVYMLANRNCGYAKYATKASAENAIKTLHGAEIHGIRIKVLEAEERNDTKRKRLRLDDGSM